MGNIITRNDFITGMDMMKYNGPNKPFMTSLGVIDMTINGFVRDIVDASVSDVKNYYIKTGIKNNCYTIMLYNSELKITIGSQIPLADTLEKCSKKTIEMDLNARVRKMLLRFEDADLKHKEVNWID